MALESSISSVLTDGLGSWSSVNLLIASGLGVGTDTPVSDFDESATPSLVTQTGSGASWSNIENAEGSPDGVFATANVSLASTNTKTVWATVFDFGGLIPPTAVIHGVTMTVRVKDDVGGSEWNAVRLIVGGSAVGTDKSSELSNLTDSLEDYVIGGPNDTWGVELEASDVRSSYFGIALSFSRGTDNATISLDSITAEISFSPVGVFIPNLSSANGSTVEIAVNPASGYAWAINPSVFAGLSTIYLNGNAVVDNGGTATVPDHLLATFTLITETIEYGDVITVTASVGWAEDENGMYAPAMTQQVIRNTVDAPETGSTVLFPDGTPTGGTAVAIKDGTPSSGSNVLMKNGTPSSGSDVLMPDGTPTSPS